MSPRYRTFTELKAFIAAEDNFANKSGISTISVSAENIDGAGGRGSVAELITFHTDIRDNTGDGFNANAVINLTNVDLLSGGVSDLLSAISLTDITGISGTDMAITATDASISIANANSLSGATNGVVTATITESTTAQILDAGDGLNTDGGANAFTIDISNTSADAGDLASIHAKTSLTVALDKVETLTGTFTELKQYITDQAQYTSKNGITTVTIDAQAIDGRNGGNLDITSVAELITFHTDIRDTGDADHGTPKCC